MAKTNKPRFDPFVSAERLKLIEDKWGKTPEERIANARTEPMMKALFGTVLRPYLKAEHDLKSTDETLDDMKGAMEEVMKDLNEIHELVYRVGTEDCEGQDGEEE